MAEKSGLIKVFDSLTDTTPTVFADLRSKVDDYWDRGLLGLALPPTFPANPWVYVLYTYDAPIGGSAPVWNDGCPTPPGPTTDGCVVSGRLSRLQANGDVMTGTEQVLINDWCQQFPSHSIGTVRFGPDGALYVSGGDGASFNGADYGQYGGSSGSPTPKNPCGDPPAGVGGTESLPSAEGGALRSQDIRTMPGSGTGYAADREGRQPERVLAAGEASGNQAADQQGTNTGTYSGRRHPRPAGAPRDGDTAVDLNGTSGYVTVPDAAALRLADGPFTLEAGSTGPPWARPSRATRSRCSTRTTAATRSTSQNNVMYFDQAGVGTIAKAESLNGHRLAPPGGHQERPSVHLYQDGVDVTGAVDRPRPSPTARPSSCWAPGAGPRARSSTGCSTRSRFTRRRSPRPRSPPTTRRASAAAAAGDPAGLDGTILRLDPATGAAMAGNPNIGSPDLNARRIISYGVRNPFRFTFRPGTSELWIGDVGFSAWEEINRPRRPHGRAQ